MFLQGYAVSLIVPTFTRKLGWAEHHLQDLECRVTEFRNRHPYRARKVLKRNNKGRWVLEFTDQHDRTWDLIVGDILYNFRATLDYLAADLNPPSVRSNVMFPIVRDPVWEMPPVDGENCELTRARGKWVTSTRHMRPEAVTIIKGLQPLNDQLRAQFPGLHALDFLNRLSNKDRHRALHVTLTGLGGPITVTSTFTDGKRHTETNTPATPSGRIGYAALENGAALDTSPFDPDDIVDMQLRGTVQYGIRMGDDGRHVLIPDHLRVILDMVRHGAVAPLSPYLHAKGYHRSSPPTGIPDESGRKLPS